MPADIKYDIHTRTKKYIQTFAILMEYIVVVGVVLSFSLPSSPPFYARFYSILFHIHFRHILWKTKKQIVIYQLALICVHSAFICYYREGSMCPAARIAIRNVNSAFFFLFYQIKYACYIWFK